MKRTISIFLAIILAVSIGVYQNNALAGGSYPSNWAVAEVGEATSLGLITDKIQENYQQDISREEFCELVMALYMKMAVKFSFEIFEIPGNRFIDTNNPAVTRAFANGIVKGISETEFAPGNFITRQEIATMLYRTTYRLKEKVFSEDTARMKGFSDASNVSDWASVSVSAMINGNIIKGSDGKIQPLENTTREQSVLLVLRMYHAINKTSAAVTPDPSQTPNPTSSMTPQDIMTVGGKIVKTNMNISEVTAIMGTPKRLEKSIHGGPALTFHDGDYGDYLLVYFDKSDNIAAYINMDVLKNKDSKTYLRGRIPALVGTLVDDYKKWVDIYYSPESDMKLNFFKQDIYLIQEYFKDQDTYDLAIMRQSTDIENAILRDRNVSARYIFNQQLYDFQKKIFVDNMDDWKIGWDMNHYFFMNRISNQSLSTGISYGSADPDYVANPVNPYPLGDFNDFELTMSFPNPLLCVDSVGTYTPRDLDTVKKFPYCVEYCTFRVVKDGSLRLCAAHDSANDLIFEQIANLTKDNSVNYTEKEKAIIAQGRALYKKSMDVFNQGGTDYFETEPKVEKLPLVAGKIKKNKLEGMTDFLNVIRLGAGLPLLEHSVDLSDAAQHQVTLWYYNEINGFKSGDPHNPMQPPGVSDEFYNKAMSGGGEIFYHGDIYTSIIHALDDTEGHGQYFERGHRYTLLSPSAKYFGIGEYPIPNSLWHQSVHKTDGSQSHNLTHVAWPADGVTFMEGLRGYGEIMWSVNFLDGTSTTPNTTVELKKLNNNKTWSWDKEITPKANEPRTKAYSNLGYGVRFMDVSVDYMQGDIFEVTVRNLKDKNGKSTELTYRSVFEKAYIQ